jgi:hypothetical protein
MDSPAQFVSAEPAIEQSGSVKFSMSGGWNGQIEVQSEDGPIGGSFKVQVVD